MSKMESASNELLSPLANQGRGTEYFKSCTFANRLMHSTLKSPRRWLTLVLAAALFSTLHSAAGRAATIVTVPTGSGSVDFEWDVAVGDINTSAYVSGLFDIDYQGPVVDDVDFDDQFDTNGFSHADVATAGFSARASAANWGTLRAGTWAFVPTNGRLLGGIAASTAYASNVQSILLDFGAASVTAAHAPQIHAYVSLSGTFSGWRNVITVTEMLPGGLEVIHEGGTAVEGTGSVAFRGFETDDVEVIGLFNTSFGDLEVEIQPEGALFYTERDAQGPKSGFVDLGFTLALRQTPLYEYIDPSTQKLRLSVSPAPGETSSEPSARFAQYSWAQFLETSAEYLSSEDPPNLGNGNFATHYPFVGKMDLTHTLSFSFATLADGGSLESLGISLHHINQLALPEPSAIVLGAMGGGAFFVFRRRWR